MGIINEEKAIRQRDTHRYIPRGIQPKSSKGPKKPARDISVIEMPKTTFADLIGLDRIKKHLRKTVLQAISRPDLFRLYKKPQSCGTIFYGPPGTGKTALARALAGEARLPLIIAKINEIVDPYTGETEKNMHSTFQKARMSAPSILFFDELDALGFKRGGLGGEGTAQVMRLAVNQFLMELDGIDTNRDGLFVIGSTNQPWDIDPAMKRSGRFDSAVFFRPPSYFERVGLFKYYMKGRPIASIDYGRLARATTGYSQADVKRLCESSATDAIDKTIKTQGGIDHRVTTPIIQGGMKPHHLINTIDLLNVIRDKELGKNSLDAWFNMVIKEFKLNLTKVDGKSTLVGETTLTMEDRLLYKELFDYIKNRIRTRSTVNLLKTFSIYVK